MEWDLNMATKLAGKFFCFFFETDPILLGRVTRGIELTGKIVFYYMVNISH